MNGLSALVIIIFGVVIGLFFIYKSRHSEARLLFAMGLMVICVTAVWIWNVVDLFAILLTGKNMENPYIIASITYSFLIPGFLLIAYISSTLLISNKKIRYYVLSLYLILSIVYGLLIFLNPLDSFYLKFPTNSGDDIIDINFTFDSVAGILYTFNSFSITSFWVLGFIVKAIKSTGVMRKKFLILALSIALFTICALSDALFPPNYSLILFRIGALCSLGIGYFGLREESIQKEKRIKPKKKIKVEAELFRLYESKPQNITEEEVIFHREKKICLVCKAMVSKLVYMCPECDALYCAKCSEALSNLDNACWVCNSPFDESKPSKLLKEEEIAIEEKSKEFKNTYKK